MTAIASPIRAKTGIITLDEFYRAYTRIRHRPNPEQQSAIDAPPESPLFIVAGPGTGKTTCLAIRILKLILVDGIPPNAILATTFTNKAAAELRSRLLGWGFQLLTTLQQDPTLTPETLTQLQHTDINQVLTGTIDSLCERILRDFRTPGTQPPILVDDFVAKTLLLREGLFTQRRDLDGDLDQFLLDIQGSKWQWRAGKKVKLLQEIWDRRFQDQVDWPAFLASGTNPSEQQAIQLIGDAIASYETALRDRLMVDFAMLEQEVLDRLRRNALTDFTDQLQIILVDEYQDTNLLQEQIYFELARACNGALTVVGDDDQSLYRFRGATVELFSNFIDRYHQRFSKSTLTTPIFLTKNYRSTQTIINFVNHYATLDHSYQSVRVAAKPPLEHKPNAEPGLPILGMFRPTLDDLATDLTHFLHQIFRGPGYRLPDGNTIECASNGGDLGDCAFLASSPAEYNSTGKPRLPLLLRNAFHDRKLEVYNPRGQDFPTIAIVQIFGGLLLESLDPGGLIEDSINNIDDPTRQTFQTWRQTAIDFVQSADSPEGLLEYAQAWAGRSDNDQWGTSIPVLQLIYALVHYFPNLHDDPEGQVYLEVFTRQVSACQQVGNFSARIVSDTTNPDLSDASVRELLRNFLSPIASGTVKVNEELMEAFPRDRLSIVSIHQSKGLEFPLTIVDVGADFKSNHHTHAFKRFPKDGSTPHKMEDLLRPHTALSNPGRGMRDRSFDDLYRQFFVAYSRPQEVLLLVGLNAALPNGNIANIATGWDRNAASLWRNNPPFIKI